VRGAHLKGLQRADAGRPLDVAVIDEPLDQRVALPTRHVQVDVGWRAARLVHEALEVEPLRHRVDRREAEQVPAERAHRRATRAHGGALLARPLDQPAHGEKELGQAQTFHDLELGFEARHVHASAQHPRSLARAQTLATAPFELGVQLGRRWLHERGQLQQIQRAQLGH
jgi:hypothetical protein